MDVRLLMMFVGPAIFLVPGMILLLFKKGILDAAVKSYDKYESGEAEKGTLGKVDKLIELADADGYDHESLGSSENARKVFDKRLTVTGGILSALGVGLFVFLLYSYVDYKQTLVFEKPVPGTKNLQVGATIPETMYSFSTEKSGQKLNARVYWNHDQIDQPYEGNIQLVVLDSVSKEEFFNAELLVGFDQEEDEDGEISYSLEAAETTFSLPKASTYLIYYYPLTVDLPDGKLWLKRVND